MYISHTLSHPYDETVIAHVIIIYTVCMSQGVCNHVPFLPSPPLPSPPLPSPPQHPQLKKRLSDLKPKLNKPSEPVKQPVIGILLSVKEEAEIQLLVSYVVTNASWSPKYDLRVSSEERTMHVSYFGMVQQNTGEDW